MNDASCPPKQLECLEDEQIKLKKVRGGNLYVRQTLSNLSPSYIKLLIIISFLQETRVCVGELI